MTKQFTKTEQITFWSGHNALFKGDMVANVLLLLSHRYIGQQAIDVGAGNGALAQAFARRYGERKHLQAFDLVPKGPLVTRGDCTSLDASSQSFDTYFCTDVIEHLNDEDLDHCLSEANRVLKHGGHGIFTTVNNENLQALDVTCPSCGCHFHRWGHCQVFTASRLHTLFSDKGFAVVQYRELNLGLLAMFGLAARMFYALCLRKLCNMAIFKPDIFLVVKKVKDINA